MAGPGRPRKESLEPENPVPKVLLTPEQQRIQALVDSASKEAPVIEDIKELGVKLEMVIPPTITKTRPEHSFKWAAINQLEQDLTKFGGIWEIVTQVNHSFIPRGLFGINGAITYMGQNILVFTRRKITDQINAATIRDFNLKVERETDKLSQQYHTGGGKAVVNVERVDDPGDGGSGTVDLTGATKTSDGDTIPEDKYDFPDTGSDASAGV